MLTCVLNAAEGQLDIILGTEAEIICAQSWSTSPRGQIKGAEVLTLALNSLFHIVKYDTCQVERWACVNGPGSFTGIRLVLGTVAAIRRISKAQNANLDFMQALAFEAVLTLQNTSQSQPSVIWVLTHARSNMVHAQAFSVSEQGIPIAIAPAQLSLLDHAVEEFKKAPAKSVIIGSGLERNKEILLQSLNYQSNITCLHLKSPSYTALWELATQANYHDKDIEPLYIRPCDAVENLDAIARKQGLEPSVAKAKLNELLNKTIV